MASPDPLLAPPEALDPAWVERQYNNRELVPDHPRFFERWERDSAFVRRTLPGRLDLAYGPHPRHRIDLFPAAGSERLLLFFHGGYWRGLDKGLFSWLAAPWVAEGVGVALANYRLCPEVRIGDIVDDAIAATNWIVANAPAHGAAAGRLAIAGHSAGGHLVGAILAAPPGRLAFDPSRIACGAPVSGVFDFSPLPLFSGNADLRLDAASARALDLHERRPAVRAPLVVAVGGEESGEFIRQSRLIAERWAPQVRELLVLPGQHHFSVLEALAERGQPLHEAIRRHL
jgi:arylformamidase